MQNISKISLQKLSVSNERWIQIYKLYNQNKNYM